MPTPAPISYPLRQSQLHSGKAPAIQPIDESFVIEASDNIGFARPIDPQRRNASGFEPVFLTICSEAVDGKLHGSALCTKPEVVVKIFGNCVDSNTGQNVGGVITVKP